MESGTKDRLGRLMADDSENLDAETLKKVRLLIERGCLPESDGTTLGGIEPVWGFSKIAMMLGISSDELAEILLGNNPRFESGIGLSESA